MALRYVDHFGKEKADNQNHHSKIDDNANNFSIIGFFFKRFKCEITSGDAPCKEHK